LGLVASSAENRSHPQLLPLLHEVAASARVGAASDAVSALAEHWPSDPATKARLFSVARAGSAGAATAVRRAVHAWRRSDEAAVLQLVRDVAETACNPASRDAVEQLALLWSVDAGTLPLLLRVADSGHSAPAAVVEALCALTRKWKTDPQVAEVLRRLVVSPATDGSVAALAVELLVRGWWRHADTLPLLRGVIVAPGGSSDGRAVIAAIDALTQRWRYDADSLALLHDVAAGAVSTASAAAVVKARAALADLAR
jgi:hypothetical protein